MKSLSDYDKGFPESALRQRTHFMEQGQHLAEGPLHEATKQFERAKRLLNDSTKYRAYGAPPLARAYRDQIMLSSR